MAQLVAAVSATAKRWRVDEIPDARYVKVGDEVVEVLARHHRDMAIRVLRGAEDSTAASHDAGTELESPTMGAAGSGEQTIRLLGPYTFTDETADIDSGAILASLPDGVLVLRVSVFPTATWTLGTELGAWVTDATLENWTDALVYLTDVTPNANNNAAWTQEGFNIAMGQLPGIYEDKAEPPFVLTGTDAKLTVVATGPPSQGSADVYVLIAEPA